MDSDDTAVSEEYETNEEDERDEEEEDISDVESEGSISQQVCFHSSTVPSVYTYIS